MNNLDSMIYRVKYKVLDRGENIESEIYHNNRRNYIIVTDKAAYLLKWNEKPFMAAGKMVPGIKGIGETINYELFTNQFVESLLWKDKYILFQWTDSHDVIYQLPTEEFISKSKTYLQRSGEKVLVISVADLRRWE